MAVTYLEGFDNLDATTVTRRFLASNSVTYSAVLGRRGSGCVGITNNGGYYFSVPASTGSTTVLTGFAYNHSSATGYSGVDFINSTGSIIANIRITSGGGIEVYRGTPTTNLLGTSSAIPTSGWNYIEVKIVSHASTGSAEIRLNGIVILNLTNVNTAGATGNFSSLKFNIQNGLNTNVYFDDIYVTDAADGFWGDTAVVPLVPTANGANTGWAATGTAWTDISEVIPDNTSYISSSTATQKSTFSVKELKSSGPSATLSSNVTVSNINNAVDGVETGSSYAQINSPTINSYLQFDLGATTTLHSYRAVTGIASSNSGAAWKIRISTDGSTWTDLESYANTISDTGIIRKNVSARYVQMIITSSTGIGALGWRIFEVYLWTVASLSTAGKTIKAIATTYDTTSTTGAATIQPLARIGGTDYVSGATVTLAGGAASAYRSITQTSPATSSSWTVSEVNGAEFGPRFES